MQQQQQQQQQKNDFTGSGANGGRSSLALLGFFPFLSPEKKVMIFCF